MSVIFIMGAMKFMNIDGTTQYMTGGFSEAGLMPAVEQVSGLLGLTSGLVMKGIFYISTTMEVVGGILLLIGMEHCAVPTLVACMIPVTFIMHLPKNGED